MVKGRQDQSSVQSICTMAQPGECIFCLTPAANAHTFTGCCEQPCHLICATSWKKRRPPVPCPCCLQNPRPEECIFCLAPATKEHTFTRCCQQTCHEFCAISWTKRHPPRPCLYCRQVPPMSTLQVIYPQRWKEDSHFVEQVKLVWKDNPFW